MKELQNIGDFVITDIFRSSLSGLIIRFSILIKVDQHAPIPITLTEGLGGLTVNQTMLLAYENLIKESIRPWAEILKKCEKDDIGKIFPRGKSDILTLAKLL